MSERVLLINPPSKDKLDGYKSLPPLGILSLAAYLRTNGITVAVEDLNVKNKWKDVCISKINSFQPSIIGLSSNISNFHNTIELASLIKSRNDKIIVLAGGPQPSIAPEDYMNPEIDYIIPFEAEKATLEFILSKDRNNIDGVINCKKDIAKENSSDDMKKFFIEDVNKLPIPAYDLINLGPYSTSIYKARPIASMITSRGCPYNCAFCYHGISGHKWRALSPENVVNQMIYLKNEIGANEIAIVDDNFTFDNERVFEICRLIQKKGLKIYWQLVNGVRADRVTRPLLEQLRIAGCWSLAICPESGDFEERRKLNKNISNERFLEVAKWCKELDISYYGFFIIGFPFQNEKSWDKTIDFAIELDPLFANFHKLIPYPKTQIFEIYPPEITNEKYNKHNYLCGDNRLLNKKFIEALIKFYLRPKKLFEIFKVVGLKHFGDLFLYASKIFLRKK